MADNKSLALAKIQLINSLKCLAVSTSANRHEKTSSSFWGIFSFLPWRWNENSIQGAEGVQQALTFLCRKKWLKTGRAGVVRSPSIQVISDTLLMPLFPNSWLSREGVSLLHQENRKLGIASLLAKFWLGRVAIHIYFSTCPVSAPFVASLGLIVNSDLKTTTRVIPWPRKFLPRLLWSEHRWSREAKTPQHYVWGPLAPASFQSWSEAWTGGTQQGSSGGIHYWDRWNWNGKTEKELMNYNGRGRKWEKER